MDLSVYEERSSRYENQFTQLKGRLQLLSAARLASFISSFFAGYFYFSEKITPLLFLALALFALFLFLIRYYDKIRAQADMIKALERINRTEAGLLRRQPSPYEDGTAFQDSHHPYSYDLDLFGQGSLYQFLNRTTTAFGKKALAEALLHPATNSILKRQAAIGELRDKMDFRHQVQAAGTLHSSEEKKIQRLVQWLKAPPTFASPASYYSLWIFPLAAISCLIISFVTGNELYRSICGLLAVINIAITLLMIRKMMAHIAVSGDINKTLQQFAGQLVAIEQQSFQAPLLQELSAGLRQRSVPASRSINGLISRFNYLDYVFNIFVSPLLNGLALFHIHVLYSIDQWKKREGDHVLGWLEIIGEIEALSSFANLSYNNTDFTVPELASDEELTAIHLGHPLIPAEKRITNDISFKERRFVVLTGSNMSGKSTFLRTLGINLVLARAGSVVCAERFRFYPFDVYVSMRITDSLQDSESFFYAELKRLHTIINHLGAGNKTFIILDEILRGTNSNDKHSGTIGLIRKLVSRNACGIIATHDLSVANLAHEYPAYVSDKCFESEIINDELLFDYRIKDGVCTKLSASFLMKKMGIIE
jgi:hypothetical protein